MRLAPALALAWLMAPAAARAAVVSYSAPASGAGSGISNTIADFDPALGTLERVQMRLTGTVSDYMWGAIRAPHYSSDDGGGKPDPGISTELATGIPYVFFYPGGSYPFQGKPVTYYITTVRGSFSGGYSEDFDSTVELPAEIFGRSTSLPPYFFGDAPGGGKTYALGVGTASFGAGTASSDGPFQTWYSEGRPEFHGTATMIYSYRPVGVAEPASPAVLGLGLGGVLAARMSRRRRV